jgi:hypothetical protein
VADERALSCGGSEGGGGYYLGAACRWRKKEMRGRQSLTEGAHLANIFELYQTQNRVQ